MIYYVRRSLHNFLFIQNGKIQFFVPWLLCHPFFSGRRRFMWLKSVFGAPFGEERILVACDTIDMYGVDEDKAVVYHLFCRILSINCLCLSIDKKMKRKTKETIHCSILICSWSCHRMSYVYLLLEKRKNGKFLYWTNRGGPSAFSSLDNTINCHNSHASWPTGRGLWNETEC